MLDQFQNEEYHYLQQFHIDYNPKADELAKERGFATWIASFQSAAGFQDDNAFFLNSSKKPTLNAWMFTIAPGENTERVLAVRNPYYWKVDTAGNQLPYIDAVDLTLVQNPEVYTLKASSGEVDLALENTTITQMPVFLENQEKGGYKVLEYNTAFSSAVIPFSAAVDTT